MVINMGVIQDVKQVVLKNIIEGLDMKELDVKELIEKVDIHIEEIGMETLAIDEGNEDVKENVKALIQDVAQDVIEKSIKEAQDVVVEGQTQGMNKHDIVILRWFFFLENICIKSTKIAGVCQLKTF